MEQLSRGFFKMYIKKKVKATKTNHWCTKKNGLRRDFMYRNEVKKKVNAKMHKKLKVLIQMEEKITEKRRKTPADMTRW